MTRTIIMLCILAMVSCQSGKVQNESKEVNSGHYVSEQPVDTISFDYEACHLSQPSLEREIYIGTANSFDEEVPVVIRNVKTNSRDTIMAMINTRPECLLEGRTKNDVFIFSIGGNGACGWLTKVDLRKRQYRYEELGLGVSDIKKTKNGFLIDRFSRETWNSDNVYREWTELWNYDMKKVR